MLEVWRPFKYKLLLILKNTLKLTKNKILAKTQSSSRFFKRKFFYFSQIIKSLRQSNTVVNLMTEPLACRKTRRQKRLYLAYWP